MTIFGRAARALAGMGVGKVTLSTPDAPATDSMPAAGVLKLQTDFARHLGLREGVPLLQHFGFTSRPPRGTDVLAIFPDGDTSNAVIIATGNKAKRLRQLAEGDAAIHDVRGAYLWFTAKGPVLDAAGLDLVVQNAKTVTVKATTKVRLETPRLEVTGDIVDHCDDGTPTLKSLRDDYNAHLHTAVQPGSGVSGPTNKPAT